MAAVTLGVGAMGGSLVALSGVAGAAATTIGSFTAKNATSIPAGTTADQKVGTMVLTINKTAGLVTATFTLTVKDTTTPSAGHTTTYTNIIHAGTMKVLVTGPATATCSFTSTTVITCHVTKYTTTATVVVTVSTVRVNSTTGRGSVKVTAATTNPLLTKLVPTSAIVATYTAAGPTTPTAVVLANDTTRPVPPIGEGASGKTVGSWTLTIYGTATQGVGAGSHVKITLEPHTGVSVCTATDAVAFAGKPKVSVTTVHTTHTTTAATKIKVSAGALSGNNGCTGFFAPNVFTVVFTSAVKFNHATGKLVINITTVKYSVAPTTTVGTVTVSDAYYRSSSAAVGAYTTTGQGITTVTSTNAVVSWAYVTVKTPKVIAPGSFDAPIGTIDVVESVAGTVPKGYVCLSIRDSTRVKAPGWRNNTTYNNTTFTTFFFNGSSKPTVKVTSGNASASTAAFATTTTRTPSIVSFKVSPSSTGHPSTFAVSGLAINDYTTVGTLAPLVTAWYSAKPTCTTRTTTTVQTNAAVNTPTDNVAVAFLTGLAPTQVIYGATADATAVAELENVYGPAGIACPTTLGGHHPVLLARDTFFSDALASQYLASYLNTGTLLTHPGALPTVTKSALAFEGITTVYVMGGPLAVSTTVVNELKALPVYHCGGRKVTVTTGTGVPKVMKVIRVTGPTEYATAEAIDLRVPKGTAGGFNAQYAYGSGTGKNFNDTTGTESKAPIKSGFLRTAILATGKTFQDAMSASAMSYATHIPVVLTTGSALSKDAQQALQSLNTQQVILMGGPLALSNSIVTALQKMTISVIRVAGKTYSDTSVQLAKFELGTTNGGIDWDQFTFGTCATSTTSTMMRALVSRGTFFTDGLTGAVLESCGTTPFGTYFHAAKRMPLLETLNPSTVGAALTAYLKAAGLAPSAGGTGVTSGATEHLAFLTIIGGPYAVNPSTIVAMETDLKS